MVDKYKTSVKGKLQRFSDYLGQKQWFTGDKVSEKINTFTEIMIYQNFYHADNFC